jgi:hypothetical protein
MVQRVRKPGVNRTMQKKGKEKREGKEKKLTS